MKVSEMTNPTATPDWQERQDMIRREIGNLRETIFVRLDGMDRALDLANSQISRVPTDSEKLFEQLRVLVSTRIDGIDSALAVATQRLDQHPDDAEKCVRQLQTVIETRLQAMDRARELLQQTINVQVLGQEKSENERFSSVDQRFRAAETGLKAALDALRDNTLLAFAASEKAIQKAEVAAEKRFEAVNEFRRTLADQTATFMPRMQTEAMVSNVNEKVDALAVRMDRSEGRGSGLQDGWGYLVGGIGLLISILGGVAALVAFLHR